LAPVSLESPEVDKLLPYTASIIFSDDFVNRVEKVKYHITHSFEIDVGKNTHDSLVRSAETVYKTVKQNNEVPSSGIYNRIIKISWETIKINPIKETGFVSVVVGCQCQLKIKLDLIDGTNMKPIKSTIVEGVASNYKKQALGMSHGTIKEIYVKVVNDAILNLATMSTRLLKDWEALYKL
jgi:hypothetical protein